MAAQGSYGIKGINKGAASKVRSLSVRQHQATDPIGKGMSSTLERQAYMWHSRKTLGANTGSAQTRTTGIGQTFGRAEGVN